MRMFPPPYQFCGTAHLASVSDITPIRSESASNLLHFSLSVPVLYPLGVLSKNDVGKTFLRLFVGTPQNALFVAVQLVCLFGVEPAMGGDFYSI